MTLPVDSTVRKGIPIFSGLLAYFPDACAAVAEHSRINNDKHNPGEPLHWSREKSNDHMDCIARHLTDIATGVDRIEELKAIAWRALAQLQLDIEAKADAKLIAKMTDLVTSAAKASEADRLYTVALGGNPERFAIEKKEALDAFSPLAYCHRTGEIGACDCPLCITKSFDPL